MTDYKERAREKASRFFSANRSVIKRLVEAENDLGFHHAKLQEELERDFAATLLEVRRETLEGAARAICKYCANNEPLVAPGTHAVTCRDCYGTPRHTDRKLCPAHAIWQLKEPS